VRGGSDVTALTRRLTIASSLETAILRHRVQYRIQFQGYRVAKNIIEFDWIWRFVGKTRLEGQREQFARKIMLSQNAHPLFILKCE